MSNLKDLKYYQNYHKHTSLSHRYNKDSPLVFQDYFNFIKDNFKDSPQIYSTVEHGWQSNYFKIYDELEKFNKNNHTNIKFVFGTEAYWVKDRFAQDSSNCHICLLAMNDNGRKKINRAIYESYKSGYYYKNRMDLDILLSLPKDDVFVTTACIAFWKSYKTNGIDDIVLQLNNHFTNFYLEVQPHQTESQKALNQHILELHYKYNIPIIAGTDSHILYKEQEADRDDLLKSNKISYTDEEGWYLDYPTLEEIISRFQKQGILNDNEIYEAINNTNKILEFEDIILDRSLKVPVLKKYQNKTQEERNQIFKNIIIKEWILQKNDINKNKKEEYFKEIQHDYNEIIGCGMADYFIDTYEIMKRGQKEYGGVLTPSGRGSAVSCYLNKLLRFTKVDKVNSPVLMYSERFLTKERVLESHTPPDIDHNVADREPFIQAQRDLIGEEGTFDLLALGTLHYKSAFKMYARAYDLDPQLANDVTKQISKYELALKHAEEDEKDLIDIYDYVDKNKYGHLIEGCQQYMGIVDNLKAHPCATVAYSGNAIEDIGVIMVKSESQSNKNAKETFVAVIESGTIDSFGFLKQDYLIVDSIGLTYDIYKEIGIEPMSVNQLLSKIDNNEKVWNIYKNGYTTCVNQCEQPKSTQKVMRYKPQNISELTQFIAGIRPSFQSMYKIFESRQHFDYGIKTFDNLIQDEYCSSSFILYQEHLMKVLGFAHFPMSETYTIIKAISKKKDYVIKNAKEKFIPNFAQAILDTHETTDKDQALQMSQKVWEVIEDSASYGFNSAHAYCMAVDSVTLAYLKAYYPFQFYKITLQRYTDKGDKDKVALLKKEMAKRGIKLKPIKFGDDNRQFEIDKEHNCITQTMQSVKNMQKIVSNIMYENKDKKFKSIFDLFDFMLNCGINKTSRDILIKLDYFSKYGDIKQLLYGVQIYDKYIKSKILTKSKLSEFELKCLQGCYSQEDETPKQIRKFNNKKFIFNILKNSHIQKATDLDKISYEIQLLGYTEKTIPNCDYYCITNIDINNYGTPFLTLYRISDSQIKQYKCNKKWFNEYEVKEGDIIDCIFKEKSKKRFAGTDINNKNIYEDTGEYEEIIHCYSIK